MNFLAQLVVAQDSSDPVKAWLFWANLKWPMIFEGLNLPVWEAKYDIFFESKVRHGYTPEV